MSRARSTMAPRYVPFGQRFGHEVGTGYQHASRFDVPLEPTAPLVRLRKRDWLMIAATLVVAAYALGFPILSIVAFAGA